MGVMDRWKKWWSGPSEEVIAKAPESPKEPPKVASEQPKFEPKSVKKTEPEWEEISVEGSRILIKVLSTGKKTDLEVRRAREKASRRAIRHFGGKEVRHRVVRKNDKEIEMSFHRRSSQGHVKFAFRKEPIELNVSKTGSA